MGIVPKGWMPDCKMDRIICHWTAGGHKASSLDRQHYHILIESNGDLVRGFHEISDNVDTSDGDYAAHTKGRNSGSIGISVCCMANARESPFDPGKFPMTKVQWERMAQVAGELAAHYGIAVTPKTILGHGEVQKNIGPPQNGKWDPMALPWDPTLSKSRVGDLFRAEVKKALGIAKGEAKPSFASLGEGLPVAAAHLNGTPLATALFSNEDVLLSVAELGALPDLAVTPAAGNQSLSVQAGGRSFALSTEALVSDEDGSTGEWVSAQELAAALDAKLSFDPDRNVVALTWV